MMQVPRVLQVFSTLGRGGAESALMTFYRSWDRDSIQFDFVVHGDSIGAFEEEARTLGARIYRMPRVTPVNVIAYLQAWTGLLRDHPEYVAVHGHYHTISALYLGVARACGIRVVAHSHTDMPGFAGGLVRILNRSLRRGADLRLACSQAAGRSFYGDRCVDSGGVIVLKNPIDTESFGFRMDVRARMRETLGVADSFVVGHVGRFNTPKNHEYLIRIFAEISAMAPHARLLLVGDGPLRSACEEEVGALGLREQVLFLGVRDDVSDLLQAMDVFVLPSKWEGFGIVALEAQASGLRTILADSIPEEARVTDLCEVVPLAAPLSRWTAAILGDDGPSARRSYTNELLAAGYDATDGARELYRLYRGVMADHG